MCSPRAARTRFKYFSLPPILISIFLIALIISGCGSGGASIPSPSAQESNVGAGRSGSNPAQTISGPVSGLKSTLEGITVELCRIDRSGDVVDTLATTQTSGGGYSFDLGLLGLQIQSDLIVRAADPVEGAKIRAFVTDSTVDISLASEAAVRLVIEKLAAQPDKALSNFTSVELMDLVSATELIALIQRQEDDLTIEQTITKVREASQADRNLTDYLQAASEAGQTSQGIGDVGNFFPSNPGNLWRFTGTRSPANTTYTSAVAIAGTKIIDGNQSQVLLSADSTALGYVEEYRRKDDHGITFQGENVGLDPLIGQFIPFKEVTFPLKKGERFIQFEKKGIQIGDVDQDGVNENLAIRSQLTVEGFEDVNVPAGSFLNAAKITTDLTVTVVLSKDGSSQVDEAILTEWYAPGIGLVKSSADYLSSNGTDISTESEKEELIGMVLNGQGQGVRIPMTPSSGRVTKGVRTDYTVPDFNSSFGQTWYSGNTQVATIDSNGTATAVGEGTAVLFAINNGQISDPAFQIVEETKTVKLTANDIVYSSLTGKLYASIGSDAAVYPGTILTIDPLTGSVGPFIPVGEMPSFYLASGRLALSKDGRYLYVGLNHGPAVSGGIRQVDLLQWSVGPELGFGLSSVCSTSPGLLVEDMEVLPDNPNAVAVSLMSGGCSPLFEGVVIYDYDKGKGRPNRLPGHDGPEFLTFSDSPSLLYGFGDLTLYRILVNTDGVQITESDKGIVYGGDPTFYNGRIYMADKVVDPIALKVVGSYSDPDILCCSFILPDSSVNRAFSLVGASKTECSNSPACQIVVFDQKTFKRLDAINIDMDPGPVSALGPKLVRWGEDGLAILTRAELILLRSPIIAGR